MPLIFPQEGMAVLEALLFVASRPLSANTLSRLTGFDEADVEQLLTSLEEVYNRPGRGIMLARVAGGYQLVTRPQYSSYVEKLLQEKEKTPPLSRAALETLSIIA